jgi:DNA-directed RNA polymerase specialized sigma24 family protein
MNPDYVAMSFEQIAERLGMSYDAVHQTYRRAMEKIRRNPEALYRLKKACEQAREGRW